MYKEILADFIIKIEDRFNQVYETIQLDLTNLDHDEELLLLFNKLNDRLDEYSKL